MDYAFELPTFFATIHDREHYDPIGCSLSGYGWTSLDVGRNVPIISARSCSVGERNSLHPLELPARVWELRHVWDSCWGISFSLQDCSVCCTYGRLCQRSKPNWKGQKYEKWLGALEEYDLRDRFLLQGWLRHALHVRDVLACAGEDVLLSVVNCEVRSSVHPFTKAIDRMLCT